MVFVIGSVFSFCRIAPFCDS